MYELIIERVIGENEFVGTYENYLKALRRSEELRDMLNTYYIGEEEISDHFLISYVKD